MPGGPGAGLVFGKSGQIFGGAEGLLDGPAMPGSTHQGVQWYWNPLVPWYCPGDVDKQLRIHSWSRAAGTCRRALSLEPGRSGEQFVDAAPVATT